MKGLFLILGSGSCRYALPAAQVLEIFRPLPAESLADTPSFVLGLAVIRGAPVPVVSLSALMGESKAVSPARFVTLRCEHRTVALAVEAVRGLAALEPAQLEELPPLLGPTRGVVEGAGVIDAGLLLLLTTARIIPETIWEKWERAT